MEPQIEAAAGLIRELAHVRREASLDAVASRRSSGDHISNRSPPSTQSNSTSPPRGDRTTRAQAASVVPTVPAIPVCAFFALLAPCRGAVLFRKGSLTRRAP